MAPVWGVQMPARRVNLDLGARTATGESLGQRRHGLTGRKRTGRAVQRVHGHAAPLLIADIHQILTGMEAVVSRAVWRLWANSRWVVWR